VINLVLNAPDTNSMSRTFVASASEMTLYMELYDSMRIQLCYLALAFLMFPQTAIAEESSRTETGSNSIEFFIGGTHSDDDDTELSLGIAYERRFNGKIGLGGLVEHTKLQRVGVGGTALLSRDRVVEVIRCAGRGNRRRWQ